MKLWKSFKAGFKNDHGNIKWELDKWFHQDGAIKACGNGFHGSILPLDAMRFVDCEILAQVSVKGKSDKEDDKQAWSDIKINKAYYWKKEDSVALSIYAAELCIEIFEKQYSDDKRPREAIEAAKRWLENPTEANRSAAWSAARSARSAAWSAAESAESAWSAAESAAWSAARSARSAAESAAWSARSARSVARSAWSARSVARSAWSAAESAAESARSAAYKKTWTQLNKWVEKRILTLEEIK